MLAITNFHRIPKGTIITLIQNGGGNLGGIAKGTPIKFRNTNGEDYIDTEVYSTKSTYPIVENGVSAMLPEHQPRFRFAYKNEVKLCK